MSGRRVLMMHALLENILIMVLTIVVLLGGAYLVLVLLGWGLKLRSGGREQQGLTDLWLANQAAKSPDKTQDIPKDDSP